MELGPLDLDFGNAEEEVPERVVLDEEAIQAVKTAEMLMATYGMEALVESGLDNAQQKDKLAAIAQDLLESGLESAHGEISRDLEQAALGAIAGASDVPEIQIEDYQSPAGFRKYDEEEDGAVTPSELDAVAPYKLTRQELANLVPQVRAHTGRGARHSSGRYTGARSMPAAACGAQQAGHTAAAAGAVCGQAGAGGGWEVMPHPCNRRCSAMQTTDLSFIL